MIAKVLKPGFLSTIQDGGRFGLLREGVPWSGSMDSYSARLANLIVGNNKEAPVIEMTMTGMRIKFFKEAILGITGGTLHAMIDNHEVSMYKPLVVRADQVLTLGPITEGVRTYLAIAGGFNADPILGSVSTYVRAGWGGVEGRAFKEGDLLKQVNQKNHQTTLSIPEYLHPIMKKDSMIRFIKGPEWNNFTDNFLEAFVNSSLKILSSSDRMGVRMQNSEMPPREAHEMISSPVTHGTIQVTPDNQFITLMSDGQTCGGYPRIGNVIAVDLPKIGQAQPGDSCRFVEVTLEEAHLLLDHRERKLAALSPG